MASATGKSRELTFVLIGAIGSGKSSTGNSILGNKQFNVSTGTVPITNRIERKHVSREDRNITVVDTPGLEDASSFTSITTAIDRLPMNEPTNITYLINIKIGRYTVEERKILEDLFKNKNPMMKNAMIIFTNKNELAEDDAPANKRVIDDWIQKNPSLLKLIKNNKLKHVAFENRRPTPKDTDEQVQYLIDAVDNVDEKKDDSICRDEKRDDSICRVSLNMNMENKIYVDKTTLGTKFGEYGLAFYEEEKELQNNK